MCTCVNLDYLHITVNSKNTQALEGVGDHKSSFHFNYSSNACGMWLLWICEAHK